MRPVTVKIAATSLTAGLLAALIPAGQASAAGPGHKVLLRNGQYGYTTQTPAKPGAPASASTPFRPKLIRDGRLLARPASITPDTLRGSISGRVTGDGHPLRGICVTVTDPRYGGPFVTTSKSGRYRLSDLRPGRYYVAFTANARQCQNQGNWLLQWYPRDDSLYPSSKAVEVRVRANHDTPGINANLKHGGQITGVVHGPSGRALGGICALAGSFFQSALARTDAQGRYSIGGLYPGTFSVMFFIGCGSKGNYEPVWWPGTSARHAKDVKVAGHRATTGIDAVMRPGALIVGTIRTEDTGHRPLGGVCLDASSWGSVIFVAGPPSPAATTAIDGRFELKGLAKGRYDLQIDPTCNQKKASLYRPTDRTVKVKSGQILRGYRVLLRPGAGVTGRVTDSHGRPLKGICVEILGDDDKAKTGPDGRYKILGIHPAKYPVSFSGGCGNTESVVGQYYKDKPGYQSATRIDFKSGKVVKGISPVMQPGASIIGTVTNKSGHPLSGTCVGLIGLQESGIIDLFDASSNVITSGAGQYRITNLTPGPYQLFAGCGSRYAPSWFRSVPDSTTASFLSALPGVTATVNFKLSRAGSISGTVTDRAGHPLGNMCVLIANPKTKALLNTYRNPAFTGSGGRYQISGLRAGQYILQFSDCHHRPNPRFGTQWYSRRTTTSLATPVTVKAGQRTPGVDAVLRTGATIRGTVTGPAGTPVGRICAQAQDPAALVFSEAKTDSQGRYSISGLGSGRYSLSFSPCGRLAPNLGAISVQSQVTAPRTTTVDARLKAGGSISGVVLDGSDHSAPEALSCVTAIPTDPHSSQQTTNADLKGRYFLRGLAPGTYRVYFSDIFCYYVGFADTLDAPQWYRAKPTESQATLVTVSAGHVTKAIDAKLVPSGTITGRVSNARLAGLGSECVTALPFDAKPDPVFDDPIMPETAITSPSGRFSLSGLFPGQYKIKFSSGCGRTGYADQWWRDGTTQKSATVINLGFAKIGDIDALLHRDK
ncbi:MAG TPA: carboxypeptidase-like regulatory domain-containing protein [Streptosporangiaceae bacterium]|nr:carboxypeptidase-like regulatory domain-containing protein [Streptosporangiaceae bacterium]